MTLPLDADPQSLQQLEHAVKFKRLLVDQLRTERNAIDTRIGTLTCEIRDLENKKYELLSSARPFRESA